MQNFDYFNHLDGASITVCDTQGVILYMNSLSIKTFSPDGQSLIGRNLKEFHSARSWEIICRLLAQRESNSYTIEKKGLHKLIKQSCWFDNEGNLGGLIELSIVTAAQMPHFVR